MHDIDCIDVKALLSGFVDDELDPAVRHLVERHLGGCAACAALVDEAESIGLLLAAEAEAARPAGLRPELVGAVLARTVRSAPPRRRPVVAWLGWVAAAAALGLAATLWLADPAAPLPIESVAGRDAGVLPHPVALTAEAPRSATWFDPEAAAALREPAPRRLPTGPVILANHPVLDGHEAASPGTAGARPADPEIRAVLRATEAVVEMLLLARADTFEDVEWLREVVEYDELTPRLADARRRLPATAAPALLAAESVLLRLVQGPLESADVRRLQAAIAESDLVAQLRAVLPAPEVF